MRMRLLGIVAAVLAITVASLLFAPEPALDADGQPVEEAFGGADGKAHDLIGELAPGYEPWFEPLFEPAGETESLLFALQAALGAGVIGFWLGAASTRSRLRRERLAEIDAATADQTPIEIQTQAQASAGGQSDTGDAHKARLAD